MLLNAKVEFSIFVAGLLLAAVTSDIRSVKMDFNIPHGFFSFCGVRKDTRRQNTDVCTIVTMLAPGVVLMCLSC